jgi:transcriptional regulator with XRE-family HTH domain
MKPRRIEFGNKNIVGSKIVTIRNKRGIKQKDFLAQLQVLGMNISATGLSRLEGQHRLVQDFEVVILAKAVGLTADELLTS